MPAKNRVKTYVAGGNYHVYNKGASGTHIFKDDQDYQVFIAFLRGYLSKSMPVHPLELAGTPPTRLRPLKNFFGKISLQVYVLLPDHFHLIFTQQDADSMSHFMTSLTTSYSMYYNRKYNRQGALFAGRYKAVLIKNNNYLLHLSAYVHRNSIPALSSFGANSLEKYPYSSYHNYLGLWEDEFVHTDKILSEFESDPTEVDDGVGDRDELAKHYKQFVESYPKEFEALISDLVIE